VFISYCNVIIPIFSWRHQGKQRDILIWSGNLLTENYPQELYINYILEMDELCDLYGFSGLHRGEHSDCGFLIYMELYSLVYC
jgi:hypothetical protein